MLVIVVVVVKGIVKALPIDVINKKQYQQERAIICIYMCTSIMVDKCFDAYHSSGYVYDKSIGLY